MADFFQNGVITTLQKLGERNLDEIERELIEFPKRNRAVLLLPALYSEFERDAMPRILEELKKVHYLDMIVLSLGMAHEEEFLRVKKIMSELPQNVKIVWNQGDRIQRLYNLLEEKGFIANIPGKGAAVWMAMGYILSGNRNVVIALHDCDIKNYSRELLARLIYPLVRPGANFEFSKGYYARVAGRLYGRVTRLFVTPLIRSLKKLLGVNKFLEFLDSFRFILSGEFALIGELARGINISPSWGLEISILSEIYQNTSVDRICQVELVETYEHKHQVLSTENPNTGLLKMASDIARILFRILSEDGIIMSEAFFRTLITTYINFAKETVEKFYALSMINGLSYDRHREIKTVEAFAHTLSRAKDDFIRDPMSIPVLSSWNRVEAAIPNFMDLIREAVEEDNK